MTLVKDQVLRDARNLSEQVYDLIRRDILQGILLPDEKLQIETVSDRYKIGSVPVREALNRLSAEGLVKRKKQRGFFVAPLEIEDLEELVKTRVWAEKRALRDAIRLGDEAWEDELILAFHGLARVARKLQPGSEREISEAWDVRHKEFHILMLDPCRSVWLKEFCSEMMDQAVRYRNISMNTHSSNARREGAQLEHKDLLDSVLARDETLACQLLEAHYFATFSALQPKT